MRARRLITMAALAAVAVSVCAYVVIHQIGNNIPLDYPTMTAHFIADYETPVVEAPHARCGVVLNNRRGDVVVMQSDQPTCRACRRLLADVQRQGDTQ